MSQPVIRIETTADDSPKAVPVSVGTDRLPSIVLLLALLSGTALMIPVLTAGPLVLDEYGTFWIAGDGPLTLWQRSLNYENIPPLAPAFNRLMMDLFGESEWSFRLSTAVWFPLAVLVSYFLGKEFRDPTLGSMCALATAWNPLALGEIRIARCYSLTLLLSAVCFWMAVRWIRRPKQMLWAFLWAIASIGLLWTHYLNGAVVLATFVVLCWRVSIRSKADFLLLCIGVAAIGFSFIPLFPAVIRMSEWGQYFGFQTESSFFETVSSIWWMGLPTGLILGYAARKVGAENGGRHVRRIPRTGWIILLGWGLAPAAAALILGHGELASLANARYRTGFQIAGSCALAAMLTHGLSSRASLIVMLSALLSSWSVLDHTPWSPKRLGTRQSSQWKEMALHVEKYGQPGEPVFVQSGLGEAFLLSVLYEDLVLQDYVACRLGRMYLKTEHPRYGLPLRFDLNNATMKFYVNLVSSIKETPHKSLWVAGATDTDLNQQSTEIFLNLVQQLEFTVVERIETQDTVLVHLTFRKED